MPIAFAVGLLIFRLVARNNIYIILNQKSKSVFDNKYLFGALARVRSYRKIMPD